MENNENPNDEQINVESNEAAVETEQHQEPPKSKKKLFIGIGVAIALLIVGSVTWALMSSENETQDNSESNSDTVTVDEMPATDDDTVDDNQSIVYTRANKTYLFDAATKSVDVIIEYPEQYSESVQRVRSSSVDPTSSVVVFSHSSEADGSLNKFSYYKTKLSLYDIATKETTPILKEANQSVTHFNWSPDGSHFSYILNDGESAVVRNLSGEIVTTVSGGLVQPIVWVDNDTISFIQNETLYRGSVEEPKAEMIVTDALKNLGGFEGPGRMKTPLWNGDHLAYESTRGNLVVLNTDSGEESLLGTLLAETCVDPVSPECGKGLDNARPIDWIDGSRLVFFTQPNSSGGFKYKTFDTTDGSTKMYYDDTNFNSLFVSTDTSLSVTVLENLRGELSPSDVGTKTIRGIQVAKYSNNDGSASVCNYQSNFVDSDPLNVGYNDPNSKAGYSVSIEGVTDSGYALLEVSRYASNSAYNDDVPEVDSLELVSIADCKLLTSTEIKET